MEKFHDYRDAYTGVHPFLPLNKGATALTWLVSLLRLPVVVLLLPVVLLLDLVLVPLAPLRRIVNRVVIRVFLALLGFFSIEVVSVGRAGASSNVYVCNHQSYVDLLVLSCQLAPVFCFAFGNELVVHKTLLSAFLFVARSKLHAPAGSGCSVASLKQLGGNVVVFAEGASTNHERCVLALDEDFVAAFDGLNLSYNLWLLAYGNKAVAFLGLSDEHFVGHLMRGAMGAVVQPLKQYQKTGLTGGLSDAWEAAATGGAFKLLKLNWEDKEAFQEAWSHRKEL